MDVDEKLLDVGLSLSASLARNTALAIQERVRAQRARGDDKATIEELSQIINELIQDKNEITRIAHAYQAELVSQRMSPGDVQYITSSVLPVIKQLADASGRGAEFAQFLPTLESLLSIEMVNVLQLLGFDFRRAVGEPLTQLVAGAITSKSSAQLGAAELQQLHLRYETKLMELAQDSDAFARFAKLARRDDLSQAS